MLRLHLSQPQLRVPAPMERDPTDRLDGATFRSPRWKHAGNGNVDMTRGDLHEVLRGTASQSLRLPDRSALMGDSRERIACCRDQAVPRLSRSI